MRLLLAGIENPPAYSWLGTVIYLRAKLMREQWEPLPPGLDVLARRVQRRDHERGNIDERGG
jgi:hypothetical protein